MNYTRRAVILWCLLPFFYEAWGSISSGFTFTPACIHAAENIRVLKLDKASAILQLEAKRDPENVAVDFFADYADFYYLMTCQRPDELSRLEKHKNIRINRIQETSKTSPYYLYAQAEINLHWAFSRIMAKEFVNAAFELRSAYRLLEENKVAFPGFAPNRKSLGMLKALLGTVPENYSWILNVIGMKGDFMEGMNDIKEYLHARAFPAEQILEKQSAEFYYDFLLLNFGDKTECWKFCESVTTDYDTNLWSAYLRAFTGIKCAHTDDAIKACMQRPQGKEYTNFYAMDYLLGEAKLNRMDKDADVYLKKFVTFYKGKNMVKDAYKLLSWYYIINNDSVKYDVYRGLALKYGEAYSDEDRNAMKESESGMIPDVTLLRARLLFDGGYYNLAEEVINSHNRNFKNKFREVEFSYRYARIMHESGKYAKAIEWYTQTIRISEGMNLYFAPNSCLQLGVIYDKLGYKNMAKLYYEKTLVYRNYEYRQGITQQAKAGLSRIK